MITDAERHPRRGSSARGARSRFAAFVVAAAVLTCTLAGIASGANSRPALTTVKVGVAAGVQAGALYWDLMVASAQGFFKRHGLKVEFVNTNNGPTTAQATVAGSVDIGVGATDAFTAAVQARAPLKVVAFNELSPEALVVTKDIKSYKDLVGKKIAVTSLGAGSSLILFKMLKAHEIDPKSINFVLSGGTPQRLAAMLSGAVQGTLVSPPADQTALQQGFKVLEYSQDIFNYMFISTWVKRDWANGHKKVVNDFVAALQDAHTWLVKPGKKYVPRHEYRATHILARYTNSNQTASSITFRTIFKKLHAIPQQVKPNRKVMLQTLAVLGQPTTNISRYF